MLAFFEYHNVPRYVGTTGPGANGFILSGDTYDELAWDLVEQFMDSPITENTTFRGGSVGVGFIVDALDLKPNLMKAMRYHEARFTDEWWKRQEWQVVDFVGGSHANEMSVADFRRLFTEDMLLRMYLISIIGRFYAKHHGIPSSPLTTEVALLWFHELGYLTWLEANDPRVLGSIKI